MAPNYFRSLAMTNVVATSEMSSQKVIFIFKILEDFNYNNNNYYKLKGVLKDGRVLRLDISVPTKVSTSHKNKDSGEENPTKSKNKTIKISLVDSYNLLPTTLESLSKSFSTEYNKSHFPYSFVKDTTLYYKGKTPNIEYYNTNKKQMKLEDYTPLIKEN